MTKTQAHPKTLPKIWILIWFAAGAFTLPFTVSAHRLNQALAKPSLKSVLGCDAFGRDLLGLTLHSSLTSAAFALAATFVVSLAALALGGFLALAQNRTQSLGERAIELLMAFPPLLISLSWAAIREPGWSTLAIALGLGALPGFTRLIYVRARELTKETYFSASVALGAKPTHLLIRHLAPGLYSLCRVKFPNLFAHALLAEATLSFLGIGAPIGSDTWGSLLAQGKDYLLEAPHIALAVGFPLVLTVLSLQLLSESSYNTK